MKTFLRRTFSTVILLTLFFASIFWKGTPGMMLFSALAILLSFFALSEFTVILRKADIPVDVRFTPLFAGLTVIPALCGHIEYSAAAAGIYVVHSWCLFLVSKNEKEAMFRILNSTAAYFLFTIPVLMIVLVYQRNPILFLFLVLVTKISDIGAYVTGTVTNALTKGGNHKMIPSISPGKSYEGAVGGLLSAVVASFIIWPHCGSIKTLWFPAVAGVVLFFGSMAGDLAESAFKRTCQVKDSGNFLPGIGGIFDLVDSLLINGVLFFLFLFLFVPAA